MPSVKKSKSKPKPLPAKTKARSPAAAPAPASRGPGVRHFLMKSEPSVFSIDDLAKAKGRASGWDGVRNYQARNLMRDEMRPGDLVLFYHSSADVTGVAGIATIAEAAHPDPTQFDPKSDYYDAASPRAAPRWLQVGVRLVEKFASPVSLETIRETPALAGMDLLRRGNRLSVQRVTAAEFETIVALAGRG
jgi:predicted RNA-binding protein with PUA-like domain